MRFSGQIETPDSRYTVVGAIFKFSPLSSLSWSNVPSKEVVSSSRRPITCKRKDCMSSDEGFP